jgi:predicted O-methyltransferase YrrM
MLTEQKIIELANQAHKEKVHPNPIFPPSVYYRFMKLLAREVQPTKSVVLGVCGGGDCLHLLEGYPHMVYGIDIAWDHPVQILTILKYYSSNFVFLRMDSVEASLEFNDGEVDILFIDTIHTYDHTMLEYANWKRKMKPNGIILLDDLFRNGMLQAWDEIPARAKIRRDDLHIGGGADDGGFGIVLI